MKVKSAKKIVAIVLAGILAISSAYVFFERRGEGFIAPIFDAAEVLAAERTFGSAVSLGHEGELLPIDIDEVLAGQAARDGYILAPTMVGLAGIDTLSRFVLRTPEEYMVGSFPRTPLEDIEPIENHITVSRQFFRAGTTVLVTRCSQYDLIRVQFCPCRVPV